MRSRIHTDGLIVTVAFVALCAFLVGFLIGHVTA